MCDDIDLGDGVMTQKAPMTFDDMKKLVAKLRAAEGVSGYVAERARQEREAEALAKIENNAFVRGAVFGGATVAMAIVVAVMIVLAYVLL